MSQEPVKLEVSEEQFLQLAEKFSLEREKLLLAGNHLLYGSFMGKIGFDFGDANIGNIVEFGEDKRELEWLKKIVSESRSCDSSYEHSLHDVARNILTNETDFDLGNYDLFVSAEGARGAIKSVTSRITRPQRPLIAFSSPNWIFERVVSSVQGVHPAIYFASTSDEFVKGFENLPYKNRVAGLIVVDPANPLGFRLTREHVQKLEDVAQDNDIVLIFDDVFRGLQEKGQRRSASEYSNKSIIVETTSKRFSQMGCGVTWTLVPKSLGLGRIQGLDLECQGCSAVAAKITHALYDCDFDIKIRDALVNRTRAFKQGVFDATEGLDDQGYFQLGFEGMPLFNYYIPGNISSLSFVKQLNFLGITSGAHWIPNQEVRLRCGEISDKEAVLGDSYIRVCPTHETAERAYFAGYMIGEELKAAIEKGK